MWPRSNHWASDIPFKYSMARNGTPVFLPDLVDGDDVVVLDRRGRPSLAREPLRDSRGIRDFRPDDFQGDGSGEKTVFGQEDKAHAAFAQEPENAVVGQPAELSGGLRRAEEVDAFVAGRRTARHGRSGRPASRRRIGACLPRRPRHRADPFREGRGGVFRSESWGIMAHSAFGTTIIDMEADQIKLVVMSAQGLDHRAAGCLAIVTALWAVLQLGIIKFVAFGAAILTSFGARRRHAA